MWNFSTRPARVSLTVYTLLCDCCLSNGCLNLTSNELVSFRGYSNGTNICADRIMERIIPNRYTKYRVPSVYISAGVPENSSFSYFLLLKSYKYKRLSVSPDK